MSICNIAHGRRKTLTSNALKKNNGNGIILIMLERKTSVPKCYIHAGKAMIS